MSQSQGPVRTRRVAAMIADALRERILDGDLADGDLLPTQDALMVDFQVSGPSVREALRILETEGLVSVRRGNPGGSIVHRPRSHDAAYMFALVLQSRRVDLTDVADALRMLEPDAVRLCAERADRQDAVVPELRRANRDLDRATEANDVIAGSAAGREFHELLVSRCGSETLIVVIGALEELWSAHEHRWAEGMHDRGQEPDQERSRLSVRDHDRLIDLIEAGDAEAASDFARQHLLLALTYALSLGGDVPIRAKNMRS